MLWELGSLIVRGVSSWFTTRQAIQKVKAEGNIQLIKAKIDAEVTRLSLEATHDWSLNMQAVKNMEGSWKDEFVLLMVSAPFIMCFVPSLQGYAIRGFEVASNTPFWYQVLLVSIFFSIYGLRDILKLVLHFMIKKTKVK